MKISVVGGYGVGMTMHVAHVPVAGESVGDGVLTVGPGGKGSNQAIACARLGAEVSLFTAVGRDPAAADAVGLWAAEGVRCVPAVKSAPTMTGFILVEPSGENRIAVAAGALAQLTPNDLDPFADEIASSDLLLVSLEIPVPVAVAALEAARRFGVTTLLNPAPAAELPDAAWSSVDYLTPNSVEAVRLLRRQAADTPIEIARTLSNGLGPTVVMTCGPSPTIVATGTDSFPVDVLPAPCVMDTTGAGDSFSAALAVALAERRELRDAVRFANGAGALAVSVDEVIPSLPRRADLEAFLKNASPNNRMNMST